MPDTSPTARRTDITPPVDAAPGTAMPLSATESPSKPLSPAKAQEYWTAEMDAAQRRLERWHTQADAIVTRYLDDRHAPDTTTAQGYDETLPQFRLNLFHANVTTVRCALYGHVPRVDVSRYDHTGNDDIARVAAQIMESLLRRQTEESAQDYDALFRAVLQDRLLGGLGVARVRYQFRSQPGFTRPEESAPLDYFYWGDVCWGWGRTFPELPWIAFRSWLTRDQITRRFGKDKARRLEYRRQTPETDRKNAGGDADKTGTRPVAPVWEIWDKRRKEVVWWSPGCLETLGTLADPLKLRNFYPCPPFLMANPTTRLYHPTPDFQLAQDLYNQLDVLQQRIAIITEAVKVVGCYDASAVEVRRMFEEGVENTLIPVDNWAAFGEKQGLKGTVDWLPLKDVVDTLDKLRQVRDETIGLLQQVTGMADIMRGELQNQYEGVGQSKIRAQFGSTRLQALQEEFADFVAGLFQLQAEVVARHFNPVSIVQASGAQFAFDQELIPQAIQLIKSPDRFRMRVQVRSETMAMTDYAQLQAERTQYLEGLSTYIQAVAPIVQQDPTTLPFMLQMLRWGMAGFKGSSEIEGVLDKAIQAATQANQTGQAQKAPSPEEVRAQTQLQLEQIRAQSKMQEIQAKLQADMQMREADKQADIQTRQAELAAEQQRAMMEVEADKAKLAAKLVADVQTELMTSRINAEQAQAEAQAEIDKELIRAQARIQEVQVSKEADAQIKIIEQAAKAQYAPEPESSGEDKSESGEE